MNLSDGGHSRLNLRTRDGRVRGVARMLPLDESREGHGIAILNAPDPVHEKGGDVALFARPGGNGGVIELGGRG